MRKLCALSRSRGWQRSRSFALLPKKWTRKLSRPSHSLLLELRKRSASLRTRLGVRCEQLLDDACRDLNALRASSLSIAPPLLFSTCSKRSPISSGLSAPEQRYRQAGVCALREAEHLLSRLQAERAHALRPHLHDRPRAVQEGRLRPSVRHLCR